MILLGSNLECNQKSDDIVTFLAIASSSEPAGEGGGPVFERQFIHGCISKMMMTQLGKIQDQSC